MSDEITLRIHQHYDRGRLDRFQFMARLVKWADEAGPTFRSELQRQAPVGDPMTDTHAGRLRATIRYSRETTPGGVRVKWTAHTPYTPFVIHGTRPHDESPVAALALHFRDAAGAEVFRRHVHHPGAKANDFPARAAAVMHRPMRDSFRNAVKGP